MAELIKDVDESQETPPLERRFSFVIHRISAQLARITNPIFSQYDLDLDTARIVVILLDRKMIQVGELIELILLPQSTISHQLRRLEKRGLIERQRLASDQRSVAVTLTAEGKKVAKAANALSTKVYEQMLGDMSAEESERLLGEMDGLLKRLQTLEGS